VEPLMSANKAVTVFRSPSAADGGGSAKITLVAVGAGGAISNFGVVVCPRRSAAHWPQKSNSGGFLKEHLGQFNASAVLHFPQNLMLGGLSNWHFEQRIRTLLATYADGDSIPRISTKENNPIPDR